MRIALLTFVAVLGIAASPASAQRAGTLIASAPVASPTAGMQSWRISYGTTDDRGAPMTVTGLVVAPPGPPPRQARNVIAWTHGTWGVSRQCAPSLSPRFYDMTPALDAIGAGDVIVAPDYPGLGSNGPHPYLVGPITARSVLDAVRAARSIPGAASGNRFAVWGESQGGHAALWTGQLTASYAPELQLVGVAAAAPPTDLAANFNEASNANAKAFLTGYTAYSWSQYYGVPLQIGGPNVPRIITKMAAGCLGGTPKPSLGSVLGILALRGGLKGTNFAATPPWSSWVASNSVQPTRMPAVLIAQETQDPLVAPAVTRRFGQQLCRAGSNVRWIDVDGNDHLNTGKFSSAATLQWIHDRFAGKPAPSDCGSF